MTKITFKAINTILTAIFTLGLWATIMPVPTQAAVHPYIAQILHVSSLGRVVYIDMFLPRGTLATPMVTRSATWNECLIEVDYPEVAKTASSVSPVSAVYAEHFLRFMNGTSTDKKVTTTDAGSTVNLSAAVNTNTGRTSQNISLNFAEDVELETFNTSTQPVYRIELTIDNTVADLEAVQIVNLTCNTFQNTSVFPYYGILYDFTSDTPVPQYKLVHLYLNNLMGSDMYRIRNKLTGTHLFTASSSEMLKLTAQSTWANEGVVYRIMKTNNDNCLPAKNVYRFYNARTGRHLYTMSEKEKTKLMNDPLHTWTYEKIVFCAFSNAADISGLTPIYRLYNLRLGTHFYTAKQAERDKLAADSLTWKAEGVGYYALPKTAY